MKMLVEKGGEKREEAAADFFKTISRQKKKRTKMRDQLAHFRPFFVSLFFSVFVRQTTKKSSTSAAHASQGHSVFLRNVKNAFF